VTRGELDQLILQYLERTADAEAVASVGGWVALAEADVRQRLRAPWMIRVAPAVVVPNVALPFELPDSFLGAVAAYVLQDTYSAEVEFLAPSQLAPYLNRPGRPKYIVIEGHWAQLLPGTGTATVRLSYYSVGDRLDFPETQNENTRHAPNIYLYAALAHASIYYGDDAAAQRYRSAFDGLVEEINSIGPSWGAGSGFRRRRI
jgi:hypothetical protein